MRLLKVFAPVIEIELLAVLEKLTLYQVSPAPAKPVAEGITTVEVPALKVRFVEGLALNGKDPTTFNVTVLLPRLIVRTLLLLDNSCVAVTL